MPTLQAPEAKSFASTADLKASYAASRARLMGSAKAGAAPQAMPPSPQAAPLPTLEPQPQSIVHPDIADIVAAVAAAIGVAPSDVLGGLSAAATKARRIAVAIARRRCVPFVTLRFGVGAAIVHDATRTLDAILLAKSIAARFTPLDALVATVVPLWDDIDGPPARGVPIAEIKRSVADVFGVTPAELDSTGRSLPLVQARHVAMGLAKRLTGRSLPEIARQFGDRDHTTVLHAVRKYQALTDRIAATLPAQASPRDWALALHRALMPWRCAQRNVADEAMGE
jgi:hypothetical protein